MLCIQKKYLRLIVMIKVQLINVRYILNEPFMRGDIKSDTNLLSHLIRKNMEKKRALMKMQRPKISR